MDEELERKLLDDIKQQIIAEAPLADIMKLIWEYGEEKADCGWEEGLSRCSS